MVGKARRQWGRSRCRGNTQMLTKPLLYPQLRASSSFLLIVYALFSFQRALKVAFLTLRFISLPRSTSFPSDSDHCTVLCLRLLLRWSMCSARNPLPAPLLSLSLFPQMQNVTPSRSHLSLKKELRALRPAPHPIFPSQVTHHSNPSAGRCFFIFFWHFAQHMCVQWCCVSDSFMPWSAVGTVNVSSLPLEG